MFDHLYQHGPGRRAAELRRIAEQAVAERVGCEQLLNQMTPAYKRNPANAAEAIRRDGYAVYDGPAAAQPEKGSPESH